MNVQVTPATEKLVRSLVATGAYVDESAVVDEAVELLRRRDELRSEIRRGLDQLDRGERIPTDEVFKSLRERFGQPADEQ